MLLDVQNAERAEKFTIILSLLNENVVNFISRFVTADDIWLHHFDPGST